MPNGNTIHDEYIAEWCDERHRKLDESLGEIKAEQRETTKALVNLKTEVTTLCSKIPEYKDTNTKLWKIVVWLIGAMIAGGGGGAILTKAASADPPAQVTHPEQDR